MINTRDKLVERLRYGKDVESWWALGAEAADTLEAQQSALDAMREAMRNALNHRYGEWTAILEEALNCYSTEAQKERK